MEIIFLSNMINYKDKDKILNSVRAFRSRHLTANDVRKEFASNIKFKKDDLLNQLDLVSKMNLKFLKNCFRAR